MSSKTALITGVGPGTGSALARRFAAGGYQVAMLARNGERLAALQAEVAGSRAFACELTDPIALAAALDSVVADMGSPWTSTRRCWSATSRST